MSPNGDCFCGSGLPRDDDAATTAELPDDTPHMGTHLRRLLGLPWLCTGSNSKDLFSVAHAMALVSMIVQHSQTHRVPCTTDTNPAVNRTGCNPMEGEDKQEKDG